MDLKNFTIELHALGCDWEIQYFAKKNVPDLKKRIQQHITHFCNVFSRFDENSILSKLNKNRSHKVTQEFMRLFKQSTYFYKQTNGIFNPLATPAHFGYTNNYDNGIFTAPSNYTPNFNWEEIKINEDQISLAEGQILDFGGIGKGYLIDELTVLMRQYSEHFMINGGGDIWVEKGKPNNEAWKIAIENPTSEEVSFVISKHTGAIATSGTTKRHWGNHHHLIDSKNKYSAKNIPLSLTVAAKSTCIADIAATTMICSPKNKYNEIANLLNIEYGYFENGKFINNLHDIESVFY